VVLPPQEAVIRNKMLGAMLGRLSWPHASVTATPPEGALAAEHAAGRRAFAVEGSGSFGAGLPSGAVWSFVWRRVILRRLRLSGAVGTTLRVSVTRAREQVFAVEHRECRSERVFPPCRCGDRRQLAGVFWRPPAG
jgi:hypothetical protein